MNTDTSAPHCLSMEEDEYAKMAEVEERMWWYRALHRNMLHVLRRHLVKRPADVLDAGCGTGGLLKYAGTEEPDLALQGIELF